MTRQAARSQAGLVTAVTAMTLADAVGGTGLPPRPGRCRPGGRRGPARHRGSLRTTYEGREYQGFIAVGNDAVEFGLSPRPGADPVVASLTWQLGVRDMDAAIAACQQAGLGFEVIVERPREDWTYRIAKVRSPNGMEVLLEEQTAPN